MTPEDKIKELGLSLPKAATPAGNYVPAVRTGNLLYLSGAICIHEGKMTHTGKVGYDAIHHEIAYGQEGARVCTLNLLAVAKAELGELSRVKRVVQVNGFVNGVNGFSDSPAVINGASDLLVEIFGEAGRHTRAAVASTGLPMNTTVELQAVLEVD